MKRDIIACLKRLVDNYEYLGPQCGSSQLYQPISNQSKETYGYNTLIVGGLQRHTQSNRPII